MSSFGICVEDGRHFKNHLHFLTSLPKRPVAAMPLPLSLPGGRLCRAAVQGTVPCSAR